MAKIFLTTRVHIRTTGAVSKKVLHIVPFTPIEVEESDIVHLDRRDYAIGMDPPDPPVEWVFTED